MFKLHNTVGDTRSSLLGTIINTDLAMLFADDGFGNYISVPIGNLVHSITDTQEVL